MLREGLFLLVMLAILLTGETARTVPPRPEIVPGAYLPPDSRKQIYLATRKKVAPKQISGPDRIDDPQSAEGHDWKETVPAETGRPAGNSLSLLDCPAPADEKTIQAGAAKFLPASKQGINFLLLGYRNSQPEILMIIGLIPGQAASLLSIRLDAFNHDCRNLLEQAVSNTGTPETRRELKKTLENICGLNIQFVIGLDLKGVIEIIDTMGGVGFNPGSATPSNRSLEGYQALDLLIRETIPPGEKQRLLKAILLKTNALELTRDGWTLLKIGYRSLSTDLTVPDLIRLRKITHSISPYQMIYRELP